MDKRRWNHKTDELRIHPSQRFEDQHPRRNASVGKKRDSGATVGKSSLGKRRETVSETAAKDPFGLGDDDRDLEEPNERAQAIDAMKSWGDNQTDWKEKEAGSHWSPLTSPGTVRVRLPAEKKRLTRERRRRANTVVSRIPVRKSTADRSWTGHGSSPKIKNDLDHDSELQTSDYEHVQGIHDEDLREIGLLNLGDDGNNCQDRVEQTERYSEEDYSPKPQRKWQDSDHETQIQPSNSGDAFSDDNLIIKRDFVIWNSLDEHKSDHVPPSNPEQNTDETNNRENDFVSDEGKKPNETEIPSETPPDPNKHERHSADTQPQPSGSEPTLIDASPIHDPIEEQFHSETNDIKEAPHTPQSPGTTEDLSQDPRSESSRSDHIMDPDPQSSPPECGQNKSSITSHFPENQITDAQPKSPSSDDSKSPEPKPNFPSGGHITMPYPQVKHSSKDATKNLNPQSKSSGSDHVKGLNGSQSPESGGVTVGTKPIQDQVGKDEDLEAWFESDAPLPGNYRALAHYSRRPRSSRPNRSSHPGNGRDSITVSPAESSGNEEEEVVDYNSIAIANAKTIRMFDEYKANSQLQPATEEQKAKYWRGAQKAADKHNKSAQGIDSGHSSISTPSSDGSFLLSPGPCNEESRTNAEAGLDDLENEEQENDQEGGAGGGEEAKQAVMNMIELHRANHELKKEIEAKTAKFEREIKTAWTRPRPPPTTEEQRLNRCARDNIESKEMFDELGDQQRPIKTDSYLVVRETEINIMITRARMCQRLDDYRRMYTRANRAVEAASSLKYPPLMARCCYYRGLASYFHRDFNSARDDFLEARGCAGLYGISSESIERYIQTIDSAVDPETAILEPFPPDRGSSGGRKSGRTRRDRHTYTPSESGYSPSNAEDATTLLGESSPRLSEHPSSSPNEEDRSAGQPRKNLAPQIQVSRTPSHTGALAPDDDPQPVNTDDVPTYQPQEEAISEEIRKDILESKAQSLSTADDIEEAGPAETNDSQQEKKKKKKPAPAPSLANTEWTLLGSATSPGTTRRVPRPHVAPITTSFATAGNSGGLALPQATPDSGDMDDGGSDEMDSDEIYAAFGGRPGGDDSPNSAQWSDE